MGRMTRLLTFIAILVICAAVSPVQAQTTPPAWPLAVPEPAATAYATVPDVVFDPSGAEPRRMDVYQPRGGAAKTGPALVFFNSGRTHPFFVALAKYTA